MMSMRRKPVTFYFNVVWDQTPHIYGTNAQTIYQWNRNRALTLPASLSNTLFKMLATCVAGKPPTGCSTAI